MIDEPLTSEAISGVVREVMDLYNRARDEFGIEDEITQKLDEASGLLDDAWELMRDVEKERG